MVRIRRVDDQNALENKLDELLTLDYRILEQREHQVLLKEKDWGDNGIHLLIFAFLGWWTLAIPNAMYALYKYETAEEVLITIPDQATGDLTSEASTDAMSGYEGGTGKWWYGVAAGSAVWVLSFLTIATLDTGVAVSVATLFFLLSWFAVPVSIYFDAQYARRNSRWNPTVLLWVCLSFVWFVNVVVGGAYLIRRYEALST